MFSRILTTGKFLLPTLALAVLTLLNAPAALAQPGLTVFVEGNCATSEGGNFCGDYDNDERVGGFEDVDGDNVYGTINGALSALGGGNGRVVIVKSGTFGQQIAVSLGTGHVQIEAADGVEANIDATVWLSTTGNTVREQGIGLLLSGQPGTSITLRNLTIRNWLIGMRVAGSVRLIVEHCRFDNNLNYAIQMLALSRITMTRSRIAHTGRRLVSVNPPPSPGTGIQFADQAGGVLHDSVILNSVGAGVHQNSAFNVGLCSMILADNDGGNVTGPGTVTTSC